MLGHLLKNKVKFVITAVYKSYKKKNCYLFVAQRDDFESVPEPLMEMFGTPELVTLINLANREKLALSDINKVKQGLIDQGYFLQVPPPEEDLLKQHRQELKEQGKLNDD